MHIYISLQILVSVTVMKAKGWGKVHFKYVHINAAQIKRLPRVWGMNDEDLNPSLKMGLGKGTYSKTRMSFENDVEWDLAWDLSAILNPFECQSLTG